jgi:hypothetical protein
MKEIENTISPQNKINKFPTTFLKSIILNCLILSPLFTILFTLFTPILLSSIRVRFPLSPKLVFLLLQDKLCPYNFFFERGRFLGYLK